MSSKSAKRKAISRVRSAIRQGPITVIEGDSGPVYSGKRGYWTTPSGKTIVRHPSAYGWPTLYHCSTRETTVGGGWLEKQIQLPDGYKWLEDNLGLCIEQISTKERYHPTSNDVCLALNNNKTFGNFIVEKLIREIKVREEFNRKEEQFNEILPLIIVKVEDSVRSGNCLQGTLNFARKHKYETDNIYSGIPASKLMNICKKENNERARRAIIAAFERLTLTQI